ncbi:cytochrome c6 PetJ [Trichothermofontia sichuanensis]|uniref:cytochrome c6 PetJ n=1 Tax=Trichothermofontia sichuanensis TaxID=3045816 RepID=UPI0036F36421
MITTKIFKDLDNDLDEETIMQRLLLILLGTIVFWVASVTTPAIAADLANGAKVFSANCAACHAGGLNVVNATKTLQKADLDKYGMASMEAIQTQVTKGKAAMPAFLGRLTPEQIEDVAAYVLAQAEKGW